MQFILCLEDQTNWQNSFLIMIFCIAEGKVRKRQVQLYISARESIGSICKRCVFNIKLKETWTHWKKIHDKQVTWNKFLLFHLYSLYTQHSSRQLEA